jgi:hypothetical protein
MSLTHKQKQLVVKSLDISGVTSAGTLLSTLSPLEVLFSMRKVHPHPCECKISAPFVERA